MPPIRISAVAHRRRRMPRRAEPTAIAHEMGNALAALADRAAVAFATKVLDLHKQIARDDMRGAHAALDAAGKAAELALRGAESIAAPFAQRVDAHSRVELAKQLKAATGADIAMPAVDHRRLVAFTSETARRMRRLARDAREQIERHVVVMLDLLASIARYPDGSRMFARPPGMRADAEFPIEHALAHVNMISGLTGQQKEQLAAEIASAHAAGDLTRGTLRIVLRERFGMMRTRARMVARDQVAKLNGQIDMDRQVALGISHFTWVSRGDKRVRPLHKRRHGRVYEWADPPLTNGAPSVPGSDPLCRCTADPVVDDLRVILGRPSRAPGTREAPATIISSTGAMPVPKVATLRESAPIRIPIAKPIAPPVAPIVEPTPVEPAPVAPSEPDLYALAAAKIGHAIPQINPNARARANPEHSKGAFKIQRGDKVLYKGAVYTVRYARGNTTTIWLEGTIPLARNMIEVSKSELTPVGAVKPEGAP